MTDQDKRMASSKDNLLSSTSAASQGVFHSALVGANRALSNANCTAIDQFRPNMFPVQFHTIRLNTDLNHVPRDWAKTSQCYGFNNSTENAFSRFSSVNMAQNYKDFVGRVDVISNSKNIKDLLKMPYQKSPHISLMVHRLGKTLLLEEFDVHKNLLRKDAEDWQWLNEFYHRCMNQREDNKSSLAVLNSPKKDPLTDEMYKNLIRHSITASVASNACFSVQPTNEIPKNIPHIEQESQDLKGFHHESIWKFQGRSMLVDSDLPIFGTDSKFPCISLRLRDSPPISVLTGLDYWLDNLMSNVPEVAMVYHQNGFVQKYEILRTEDIPHIENSSFEPEEVMELARNVMAFIKSRAAVEGHTYWLYKSETDDMVKLYDLTEYCKKELRQDDNPFTVPVGVLCYNVGRNLKLSGQRRAADCRAMLENSLRLLNAEKHPQVCSDAHHILSDMWVPDKSLHDIWQGDGKIADPPDDLYDEEDDSNESDSGKGEGKAEANGTVEESNVVSVKSVKEMRLSPRKSPRKRDDKNEVALQELVVRGMIKRKAWDVLKVCRIAGETDERCQEALVHIRKGLGCIDKDISRSSYSEWKSNKPSNNHDHTAVHQNRYFSSRAADIEREHVRVAKPFVPIPLHYTPINPKNGTGVDKVDTSSSTVSQNNCAQPTWTNRMDQWHIDLKFQLLRKAAIAFCILANQFHDSLQKRGHTLRYVRYGLHCFECLSKLQPKRELDSFEEEVYFHLIHLAAKARSCLERAIWETSRKDYEELNEEEAAILHSAQAILQTPKEAWVYTWSETEENNLTVARELFQKLMQMKCFEKKPVEVRKTVRRQLGICILNLGRVILSELGTRVARGESFESIEPLMEKCKNFSEESVTHFLKNNEKNNAGQCAMCLYSIYEHAAQAVRQENKDTLNPISKKENKWIQKMFDSCERTLSIFERNESSDSARENVYKIMREKYFNLSCRYFEAANARHWPAIKAGKDLLVKSLNCCFLDPESPHVRNSQRIGAIVNYNLAKFSKVESEPLPSESPRCRALCRKMYEYIQTACELYGLLKWSKSQIDVKRFLVDTLLEDFDSNTVSQQYKTHKRKILRNVLAHCCELQPAVDCIHTQQVDKEDDSQNIPTVLDAAKVALDMLNKAFKRFLKVEKSGDVHDELKKLYLRSLSLTTREEVEFIAFPLSQLYIDVSHFVSSDVFN